VNRLSEKLELFLPRFKLCVEVKEIALCGLVEQASWSGDWLDILLRRCALALSMTPEVSLSRVSCYY
jgi:hypothetical protein